MDSIVFNHIPEIIQKLPKIRSQLVRAGAFNVQRYSQEETPVETGFLKNSEYTVTEDSNNNTHPRPPQRQASLFPDVGNPPPGQALVLVGASYGVFVHEGTIHQPANPFLLRGAMRAKPEYEESWRKLEGMLAV